MLVGKCVGMFIDMCEKVFSIVAVATRFSRRRLNDSLHAPAAQSFNSRPLERGPALGRTRAYSDQVEGFSRRPLLPLHRGDSLAQPDPLRVCYGP